MRHAFSAGDLDSIEADNRGGFASRPCELTSPLKSAAARGEVPASVDLVFRCCSAALTINLRTNKHYMSPTQRHSNRDIEKPRAEARSILAPRMNLNALVH